MLNEAPKKINNAKTRAIRIVVILNLAYWLDYFKRWCDHAERDYKERDYNEKYYNEKYYNEKYDEVRKEFKRIFTNCPICNKRNDDVRVNSYRHNLSFCFKSVDKAFLIDAYKKFNRKGVKFGIPCCKCYREVFKEKRNVEEGDQHLPQISEIKIKNKQDFFFIYKNNGN